MMLFCWQVPEGRLWLGCQGDLLSAGDIYSDKELLLKMSALESLQGSRFNWLS